MSRVRDALKRANAMTPSAETEAISEVFAGGRPEPPVEEESFEPDYSSIESAPQEAPAKTAGWLMRHRFLRKLLRRLGVRTSAPVQKCQGTKRNGEPCRGPAMANGYCRLHGGSRQGAVLEKTRNLIDRVMPAR